MKRFKPTIYINNVFEINIEQLKKNGVKMLCFDLDNTLDKPDNITDQIDNKVHEFLNELREHFEVMIVSNNTIKGRVSSFADLYKLDYIEAMKKPFKKNYKHQNIMKYAKDEVVFIGDKLITDVLGANRLGYKSILVDPLYPKSPKWYNKVMTVSDKVFIRITSVKREEYFNSLENNAR